MNIVNIFQYIRKIYLMILNFFIYLTGRISFMLNKALYKNELYSIISIINIYIFLPINKFLNYISKNKTKSLIANKNAIVNNKS